MIGTVSNQCAGGGDIARTEADDKTCQIKKCQGADKSGEKLHQGGGGKGAEKNGFAADPIGEATPEGGHQKLTEGLNGVKQAHVQSGATDGIGESRKDRDCDRKSGEVQKQNREEPADGTFGSHGKENLYGRKKRGPMATSMA